VSSTASRVSLGTHGREGYVGQDVLRTLLALGLVFAAGAARPPNVLELHGRPLQLVAGRGSLWALTCDRGCSGEARRSSGRVIRIDPIRKQVVASARLSDPSALGVGEAGVFATDFWRGRVRRLDPRTLRVVAARRLVLPFELVPGDRAFLPENVAVAGRAVWVSTARGVLVRLDPSLRHVVASVRLPPDTVGGIAVGDRSVWVAESLLGLARIDAETNVARVHVRVPGLAVDQPLVADGRVFAVGGVVSGRTLTGGAAVAAVAPRIATVARFPRGPAAVAAGGGSVWAGRMNGDGLVEIDASSGRVVRHLTARIGIALAHAGGKLWTVDRDGRLRVVG
jgi:hypothetical protein